METIRVLLQRYLKAAWRHRWVALALTWLVCGLGWAAVYTMPNQYEADARLYVDADAVLTPLLRGLAADSEPTSQIEMLQRTLLSRPNIETLIDKTDLDLTIRGPDGRERLVQALTSGIKIERETNSLFRIVYRNPSPKRAVEVVQTLLSIFMEHATGGNRTEMDNARQFLNHQIASYEQQLRSAESRRAAFKIQYAGLLPSEIPGGSTGLEAARGQVQTLKGNLIDATAKRDQLKTELASTPPLLVTEMGGGGGPGGGGGQSRLRAAEDELTQLRTRYTDAYPDVVAMQNTIASLRAHPEADGGTRATAGVPGPGSRSAPNPVYEQLKTRLVDDEADVASLTRQVGDATANLNQLEKSARLQPEVQAKYESLDRDYTVLRKNYEELLARREEANIAQAADTQADKVKLQIVDPPQLPRIPVAPNRVLLTSGVLLAGIAAGVGAAMLLGQLDRSFRSVEDLRSLGLTVLGGISALRGPAPRGRIIGLLGFGLAFLLLIVAYGGLLSRMTAITTAV